MAWLTDPYGTTDYTAADAVTDALAAGAASRLYRRLIIDGDGTFSGVDASITGSEGPGLLTVSARLTAPGYADDATCRHAAEMLLDECNRLCGSDAVSVAELGRLQNRQRAAFRLDSLDYVGRAASLALAVYHREAPDAQLRRYCALTTADMRRVAQHFFRDSLHGTLIVGPPKP